MVAYFDNSNNLIYNDYMLFSDKPDTWVQRYSGTWHQPFIAHRKTGDVLEWARWLEHDCERCGKKSLSKKHQQLYCTKNCANQAIKKFGKNHRRWNNGRAECTSGYIMILVSRKPRKYVFEHRLVMEKHLGRKLLLSEIVHHINENKSDNRLKNLQLVTRAEHIRIHHPYWGHPTV